MCTFNALNKKNTWLSPPAALSCWAIRSNFYVLSVKFEKYKSHPPSAINASRHFAAYTFQPSYTEKEERTREKEERCVISSKFDSVTYPVKSSRICGYITIILQQKNMKCTVSNTPSSVFQGTCLYKEGLQNFAPI